MQLNRLKTEFINISTLSASPLKIGDSLSILHQSVDKNRFVSPSIRQPDTTAFIILIRRCTGCFNFIYWDNNCKVSLGIDNNYQSVCFSSQSNNYIASVVF